eukprot:10831395-Heterocapsa_arctica.AAC.1
MHTDLKGGASAGQPTLRLRVHSHTTFSIRTAGSEPGLQTCCRSSVARIHRFTLPTKPSLPMHCLL